MSTEKNTSFEDDQTQKRIHEHLTNEHDIISDDDIVNVKTSIGEATIESSKSGVEESSEDEPAKMPEITKKDGDEIPRIETPWNILS